MAKKRTRYSAKVRDEVRKRYPLCRNTEDREALAESLGIESVSKLYNLASRLKVAGKESIGNKDSSKNETAIKEDPKHTSFSKQDDRYIKKEFGRRSIEDIAFYLNHSEMAIAYRARQLEMRKPVKNWRLNKVASWFGMSESDFETLQEDGIEIFPLTNLEGRVVLSFVSTTSLARWLSKKKNINKIKKLGADEFFILEILESVDEIQEGKTSFESCKFLSHGHVCQNPRSELCFGLFCTNNERHKAGEDPLCTVRFLELEDLAPDTDKE